MSEPAATRTTNEPLRLVDDGTPTPSDQDAFREELRDADMSALLGRFRWYHEMAARERGGMQVIIDSIEAVRRDYEGRIRSCDWCLGEITRELSRHADEVRDYIARKTRGKKKSCTHETGLTVGFRTIAEKLVIDDRAVATAFAVEAAPEAAVEVTTTRLDKAKLDAWFATSGEVPQGCHVVDAHEDLYVK